MDQLLFATRPSLSSTQMAKTTSISFTTVNKIPNFSAENRIDYHLERIMKRQRLIYFKNSIRNLPIEDRIVESILEIMHTNQNLIKSRMNRVQMGRNLCRILRQTMSNNDGDGNFRMNMVLSQTLPMAKNVCTVLAQLNWALNSNKEHVKYLVKVHVFPETYRRRDEDADQPDIHIKSSIINMVMECEKTIACSQQILDDLKQLFIMVYLKTLM